MKKEVIIINEVDYCRHYMKHQSKFDEKNERMINELIAEYDKQNKKRLKYFL